MGNILRKWNGRKIAHILSKWEAAPGTCKRKNSKYVHTNNPTNFENKDLLYIPFTALSLSLSLSLSPSLSPSTIQQTRTTMTTQQPEGSSLNSVSPIYSDRISRCSDPTSWINWRSLLLLVKIHRDETLRESCSRLFGGHKKFPTRSLRNITQPVS